MRVKGEHRFVSFDVFLICLAGDGNIALEEGMDVLQQASAYYLAEIDKSAHRGEVSNATSLR